VLEAFACGRPVIASALDGIPEAFDACQCGRLVPPEDIERLGEAMIQQAKQAPLSKERRWELHRQVGERFSVEAMIMKVSELYRRLLVTRPS
jgi:glycosyltransferase involved in cell wall biosynthesis